MLDIRTPQLAPRKASGKRRRSAFRFSSRREILKSRLRRVRSRRDENVVETVRALTFEECVVELYKESQVISVPPALQLYRLIGMRSLEDQPSLGESDGESESRVCKKIQGEWMVLVSYVVKLMH